jgi:hypothetical protein
VAVLREPGHQIGARFGPEGDDEMVGCDPSRIGLRRPACRVDGQDLLLQEAEARLIQRPARSTPFFETAESDKRPELPQSHEKIRATVH